MIKTAIVLGTIASLALGGTAFAQDTFTFAVVPKAMNNPFFDLARDGCRSSAKELGNVDASIRDRSNTKPATQAQIIQDFDHPEVSMALPFRSPIRCR